MGAYNIKLGIFLIGKSKGSIKSSFYLILKFAIQSEIDQNRLEQRELLIDKKFGKVGLYSSWGSINYSLMGPEQTLQPLSLFIKFINFICDNISHFIGYVKNHFSLVNLKDQ